MFAEDGIVWKTRFTNMFVLANKIWPNDVEVVLHFQPKTDDPDLQNLVFEKYKYCFAKVFQNAMFIANSEQDYKKLGPYSHHIIDFPIRPIDQMVGTAIFAKLNSIGGDSLKVSSLSIESWQGENLQFVINDDSPEWDFMPNEAKKYYWWMDNQPNFSNFSEKRLTWEEIGFTISATKSQFTVIKGNKNES